MEIDERLHRIQGIINMIIELKKGQQTSNSKFAIQKLQQELDTLIKK